MKVLSLPLAELSIVAMLLVGVPALEGMVSIAASVLVGGESLHVAVQLAKADGTIPVGCSPDCELGRPVRSEKFADQLAYFAPLTQQMTAAPHAGAAEPAVPPAPVTRDPGIPATHLPAAYLLDARTAVNPLSTQASAALQHAL